VDVTEGIEKFCNDVKKDWGLSGESWRLKLKEKAKEFGLRIDDYNRTIKRGEEIIFKW